LILEELYQKQIDISQIPAGFYFLKIPNNGLTVELIFNKL
jgi:hypothetical protein